MTAEFQAILRAPLQSGNHVGPDHGSCVMECVCILWALHTGQNVDDVWSDAPLCTNDVVARVAQLVNDGLNDEDRQNLNLFLPRLLRARRTSSDEYVNMHVNLYLLGTLRERFTGPAQEGTRQILACASEKLEQWLLHPSASDIAAVGWLLEAAASEMMNRQGFRHIAKLILCAADVVTQSAGAFNLASCLVEALTWTSTTPQDGLVALLDGVLDAWEIAVVKVGEELYVPREWEDAALAFVADYMSDGSSG